MIQYPCPSARFVPLSHVVVHPQTNVLTVRLFCIIVSDELYVSLWERQYYLTRIGIPIRNKDKGVHDIFSIIYKRKDGFRNGTQDSYITEFPLTGVPASRFSWLDVNGMAG